MDAPAVSVVIPTRNRSALLEEAVRSVLAQTLPAHEIIVVDDSSDPEHLRAIRTIADSSDCIHIHRLPSHSGVSAARNLGLDKATGDFILFLDDDDLLHPRMLEASVHSLRVNPVADVVTCLARGFIDHDLSAGSLQLALCGLGDFAARASYPLSLPQYVKLTWVTFSDVLRHAIVTNSCVVRRRCLGSIRFPEDLTAGEDIYFWLQLASRGCQFVLNPEFYAYVRYHSAMSQASPEHSVAVPVFFEKLLASGMVTGRRDRFIVHYTFGRRLLGMKRPLAARHLALALGQPDLLLRHVRWFCAGLRMWRLLRPLRDARLTARK